MAVEFTQLPDAKSITFFALNGSAGMNVLHGRDIPPVQAGRTVMNGSIPYQSGRIRLMEAAIDPGSYMKSIAEMGVSGGETIPLVSYSKPGPATTVGEKAWAIVIYDKLKHSYGQTAAFDIDSTPNVNEWRQSAINNGWINSSANGHTTDFNHRWYEQDERSLTIGSGASYIDLLLPSGVFWFTHGAYSQVSASATTANILALEGRIKLIEYTAQNVTAASPPAVITSSTILCNDSGGYYDSAIMAWFTITNISGPTSNRTTVVTFKQGLPNNSGAYQINSYADFLSFCTAAAIPLNTDITVHASQPGLSDAPCFRGGSGSVTDQSGFRTFNIGPASIAVTGGSTFRNVGDDVTLHITRIFLSDASGNCGGGGSSRTPAAATLKGSGIAHEFMSYTNSSTPAVLFNGIDPVQGLIFNLADRPPIDFGIDVADSSLNGSTHWLHYSAKDKSDNIATTFSKSFKIDNDLPIISDVSINNGIVKTIDDEVMVYANIKDNTSGVIQYYISETLGGTEDTSTRLHTTLAPVISPAHTVDRMFVFNSTPGVRTLELKAMDQADNYTIESLTIEKSSQSAVWNSFTVTRDPVTAFMVNINVDAQIVPDNPDLLSQYYFTFDRFDIPDPADYIDLRNNMDTAHWIDSLQMVDHAQHTELYVFVKTRDGFYTKATAVIDNSNSASLGILQSIDPAEGEIEVNLPIKRTSNRRNSYRIRAKGNTAYYSNATQPNADLITGYTIRDDNTTPSNVPQYNTATLQYEDTDGNGWNIIDPVNNEYEKSNQDFDFTGSGGTTTVRLFASTVGNVLISAAEVVEFETDQEGPQANNVIINGNTATVTAGSAPNERFEVPDALNISSIPVQIDLYDVSDVYRWKFSAFQIPSYNNLKFDTTTDWNIETTPTQNLTVNVTVNFSVSSLNTYYIYSMDALENVSENRIKVEYIDPSDLAAMGGGVGSADKVMTKFEGKAHEHLTRNSITSMFGGGTRHETFISRRHGEDLSGHEAKSIIDSRTHKLSEYSGLRVYDNDTRTQTNLPDAGSPIKFSDFKGKRPLITSQRISAYTTNRTLEEIPNKIGDIRNFCILMDIDTGIGANPHIPLENQNLIDIDATWSVRFIPAFDNTIQLSKYPPARANFSVSSHGVLTCNFDDEGTYVVKGTTSFGDVLIGTYFISNSSTVSAIPTNPNVLGPVPSSGAFDVSYDVERLALGVDAVFLFDASGSYASGTPSFLDAAISTFPTILDKIDDFSRDSFGNSNSRYAVAEFGDLNEIKLVSNFGAVNSRTSAINALSNITLLGGVEPQWAAVKQVADQTISPALGDWRTTALKMILLFSDTYPDDNTNQNDWVAALNNKEIYFVLFDGEVGISPAFFNKGVKFISIIPLKAGSGDLEISNAMTKVFDDYKTATSYDLRPHIPGIFKSCVANPTYHSGAMPIPYSERSGGKVHFKVELDEDVINNFIGPAALISAGTAIQIETYITTYNATNNPIERQKLIISHTF